MKQFPITVPNTVTLGLFSGVTATNRESHIVAVSVWTDIVIQLWLGTALHGSENKLVDFVPLHERQCKLKREQITK